MRLITIISKLNSSKMQMVYDKIVKYHILIWTEWLDWVYKRDLTFIDPVMSERHANEMIYMLLINKD